MTDSDLAADRALVDAWRALKAATTPAWTVEVLRDEDGEPWSIVLHGVCGAFVDEDRLFAQRQADFAFMAAAHESPLADRLAARLDELEAARVEVASLQSQLCFTDGRKCRIDDAVKAFTESAE